jgi:hypothetical protein
MKTATITRPFRVALAATAALLCVAAPASAHEDAIGDGGPFTVVVETELPDTVEARWSNGEVEMHVAAGTTVEVLGVENEPFVKIDEEGAMFANENSPTWMMVKDGMDAMPSAMPSAEPSWKWIQSGGSLQFHDHRIHFMDTKIDPALANGGKVFDFKLPMIIDGAKVDVVGALMFDPAIDPAAADKLLGNAPEATTTGVETQDSTPLIATPMSATEDEGSGMGTGIAVIAVLALAAAGGVAVMVAKRR